MTVQNNEPLTRVLAKAGLDNQTSAENQCCTAVPADE